MEEKLPHMNITRTEYMKRFGAVSKKEGGLIHSKSKALDKAKTNSESFEKWRSSRSGTHSPRIAKKLGIKLYE